MSRFVRPEVKVLKISQGDTLTVKCRLNAGEQRSAFARMMTIAGADGIRRVDPTQVGITLMLAYLVDWSLTDDDGKVVDIREQSPDAVMAALDALDTDSFTEIKDAIEAHDNAMRAERAQEKNSQDGANGSSAISPSLDGVAGVTSGSVN